MIGSVPYAVRARRILSLRIDKNPLSRLRENKPIGTNR
jgi:hypothetical protein